VPLFRRAAPPKPPADPADWRPQKFGRGGRPFKDAIIEPSWGGVRILATVADGKARLVDEEGEDLTSEFQTVADKIAAVALSSDLILDGFLSIEPTQDLTGRAALEIQAPKAGKLMAQMIVGDRLAWTSPPVAKLDPARPVAFVAVDLLAIDGTHLLDVPLLERKRLLDGALTPTDLVRVTPFIRPPIGSFITTWRNMSFYAMAYKAANSHYTPNARNDDWSIVQMPPPGR
jgi:bifunctional non-homologous end joining protein LigD